MRIFLFGLAVSCLFSAGCTICASPYDDHYAAFGGRWQRDVENHGRVGSAFTEAGFRVEDEAAPDGAEGAPAQGVPGGNGIQPISYEMPYDESLSDVDASLASHPDASDDGRSESQQDADEAPPSYPEPGLLDIPGAE